MTLIIIWLIVLTFAFIVVHREHTKLWYFHKHSPDKDGDDFRKYIGEDK